MMYRYLSSIRHVRGSSLLSLLSPKYSLALASRYGSLQNDIAAEYVRGFSTSDHNPFSIPGRQSENPRTENDGDGRSTRSLNLDSFRDRENMNSRSDNENKFMSFQNRFLRRPINENYAENGRSFNRESDPRPPFYMRDGEQMNPASENDGETEKSYRPMDFVRGVIDKDEDDFIRIYSRTQLEKDADYVHIKLLRNNTFVTVTDSKGNIKLSGSAGSLKEMKTGQKLSRYAAEATAEVVGRRARGLGLKAVVMKVNGFTHFRRKRQAIMSWLEGFSESRGERSRNPVVHIEDTTRKPHNGCRRPKKRRI